LRKAGRRKTVSLTEKIGNDEGREIQDTVPANDPGAAETIYDKELESIIGELIASMPARQREVLLLRNEMPFKEIARIVGCTVSTAKSRMRYALEFIRRGLAQRDLLNEVPRR